VSSAAKIAANRRNAQRSTGPRSAAGKARTRYNAFRHGLSLPPTFDERALERMADLAGELVEDGVVSDEEADFATFAGEAQVEAERVRQVKVQIVNQSASRLAGENAGWLPAKERAALAFAGATKTLVALDRYEDRALSRRKGALRALKKLQIAQLRRLLFEPIGPPCPKRPRNRNNLFDEDTLALDLGSLLKPLANDGLGRRGDIVLQWYCGEQTLARIQYSVWFYGDHARLTLAGRAWGQDVRQEIIVACTPTKVGGVTWSFKCAETGKVVKYLYLIPGGRHFRSRHALGLTYCVNTLTRSGRYVARAERLMKRLGGTSIREKPPRPKHMRRSTYEFLWNEIREAYHEALENALQSCRRSSIARAMPPTCTETAKARSPAARSKSLPSP
jgi:hypothetical protein